MRLVLFTLAIAIGMCTFGGSAMSQNMSQNLAQNYPWCAYYAKAGANCGFATYEQCMAALSGNGGFCNVNSQYVPAGPRGGPDYPPR
jgi:hypothetical protein